MPWRGSCTQAAVRTSPKSLQLKALQPCHCSVLTGPCCHRIVCHHPSAVPLPVSPCTGSGTGLPAEGTRGAALGAGAAVLDPAAGTRRVGEDGCHPGMHHLGLPRATGHLVWHCQHCPRAQAHGQCQGREGELQKTPQCPVPLVDRSGQGGSDSPGILHGGPCFLWFSHR